MNSHRVVQIALEVAEVIPAGVTRAERAKPQQNSLYASLLQRPTSTLASNVSDRADVFFTAILGYN
ncbi:hypothetical protein [Paraburkholderia sp. HD33-4]|uniref:hypothetical protein n=1 Tax=Paraburkholderia sp. HD33-4 TaxID=2883242 RepID=UPI001F29C82A|nr:hypothetical protein [Paraburkholderia sp. HD33-4]